MRFRRGSSATAKPRSRCSTRSGGTSRTAHEQRAGAPRRVEPTLAALDAALEEAEAARRKESAARKAGTA
jgi:hypothetical protein